MNSDTSLINLLGNNALNGMISRNMLHDEISGIPVLMSDADV